MHFNEFIKGSHLVWTRYFKRVSAALSKGILDIKDTTILFPNIMLVTNCRGYFVVEFIGAVENFSGLKIKKHKEPSIYRYLSQFDDSEPDSCIRFDAANNGMQFICLSQQADLNSVKKRFPQMELYEQQPTLNRIGGKGSPISFGSNFTSCAIENCILINRHENIHRCKNILAVYVVKSGISKEELYDLYEWTTKSGIKGVHFVDKNKTNLIVAGQLQSMYLFPSLRETTIGEFINLHPEIIKKAFKTEHFEYEPYLEWLEHDGTCEDDAINPDLMIKRYDNFYDIYDLKTALLSKASITKGKRKRRRFIDYVEEGVAQLANYREYFKYEKNAQHARKKYGINVSNPKLVLVVGSFENANIAEINQACRRYEGIDIIDYDTLCHLFIGKAF